MSRNGPTGRRGSWITRAAIAAALGCALGVGVAAASADPAVKQVRFGGQQVEVPASWPVYDLAEDPSTCVRFDRHAVYLGHPSAEQRCPAHSVGRSEAILIEPDGDVTATSLRHPGVVRRALGGASPEADEPQSAGAGAQPRAARAGSARGAYHQGLGFDACTAPSKSAMQAWKSSPYTAAGVYIGGVNRGCTQPNLTASWVRREIREGWALMPIYVGRLAPGTSCNCVTISRSRAKSQGLSLIHI